PPGPGDATRRSITQLRRRSRAAPPRRGAGRGPGRDMDPRAGAAAGDGDAFIAWFEPEHRIVDRVAPFFARRFAGMRWAILTPDRSARWDGQALAFGDGALPSDAPPDDA